MATPSFCSKTHAKQFNEASLNPLSICLSRFNASFIKPKQKKNIYFSLSLFCPWCKVHLSLSCICIKFINIDLDWFFNHFFFIIYIQV